HTRSKRDWSSDVCSSDLFLIAYLIFMLSSLAVGLASENTQAVNSWQTQSVVLNDNSNVSLSQSLLTKENLKDFKKTKNDSYIGRSEERRVGKERRWGR